MIAPHALEAPGKLITPSYEIRMRRRTTLLLDTGNSLLVLRAERIPRRHQTPLPEFGVERHAPGRRDQRRARHRIERLTACTRQLVADLRDRRLDLGEERRDV